MTMHPYPRACQPEPLLLHPIVKSIETLSKGLYLLDLTEFPEDFHPRAGQFLHLKVSDTDYPLLRRPISIQSYQGGVARLLIREVGVGTRILHRARPGDRLDTLGPLGTTYTAIRPDDRVLMVGGGVGVAPLIACCHGAHPAAEIDFCFGVATAAEIQGAEPFQSRSEKIRFHFSTDDGTAGHKGFCTEVASRLLAENSYTRLFTCGPWIMMAKACAMAAARSIPAESSLEVQMGCGLGACLGCVYETPDGDFIRSCIDGPVVDAATVLWDRP